jgi:hypothetical protein
MDEDRALELSEELARHSLIYLDARARPGHGCWRPSARSWPSGLRPVPTLPGYAAKRADYYRRLTEAGPAAAGVEPERVAGAASGRAGNLAAAVRWYLAHDPGPLPHPFRILWPFWFLRDHMREGLSGRATPARRGPLDPRPARSWWARRWEPRSRWATTRQH